MHSSRLGAWDSSRGWHHLGLDFSDVGSGFKARSSLGYGILGLGQAFSSKKFNSTWCMGSWTHDLGLERRDTA